MKRTFIEACPLCDDLLQCVVIVGNLGSLDAHFNPVIETELQWGTGNPEPPPTAIKREFTPTCPHCSQSLDAAVVITHLYPEDVDEIEVKLQIDAADDGTTLNCSTCSKQPEQLYGSKCKECFTNQWDAMQA